MQIKQYRKQLGLTQRQLAEKLDIGFRTLQRYENGDKKPKTVILLALEALVEKENKKYVIKETKTN